MLNEIVVLSLSFGDELNLRAWSVDGITLYTFWRKLLFRFDTWMIVRDVWGTRVFAVWIIFASLYRLVQFSTNLFDNSWIQIIKGAHLPWMALFMLYHISVNWILTHLLTHQIRTLRKFFHKHVLLFWNRTLIVRWNALCVLRLIWFSFVEIAIWTRNVVLVFIGAQRWTFRNRINIGSNFISVMSKSFIVTFEFDFKHILIQILLNHFIPVIRNFKVFGSQSNSLNNSFGGNTHKWHSVAALDLLRRV